MEDEMNIALRTASLALSVLLGGALAGCNDAQSSLGSPSSTGRASHVADDSASPAAAPSPIDGTWRIEHNRAELVAQLKESGFGKWAQDFLETEQVWAQDNWVWTFSTSTGWYEAKWQNPDGSWKSAQYGPLAVDGDTLTLTDSNFHTIDTFGWEVEDGKLRLTYVKTDGPQYVKGIPEPVYMAAYLSDPLERGKCPPAAEPCS
jgi:hypothetical protein